MRTRSTVACLTVMLLAVGTLPIGCATAEAAPLEVTYYYLPG